jgi:hypothetical protein
MVCRMVGFAIVAAGCFIAGTWAATKWLPPLADGPVGTLAYFVVCGLAGAVLAVVGIHVWQIGHIAKVKEGPSYLHEESIIGYVDSLIWEAGTLAGVALVAYVLAPKAQRPESN